MSEKLEHTGTFTGRARDRTTRRGVILADKVSKTLITVGGIGTILAVLAVALFLVWVAMPLFFGAEIGDPESLTRSSAEAEVLHLSVDEYQLMGWVLLNDGTLDVFRLDTGTLVESHRLVADHELESASILGNSESVVLGLSNGEIRTGTIGFRTAIENLESFSGEMVTQLETGAAIAHGQGMAQLTPQGQVRVQQLAIELEEGVRVGSGPVAALTHVERPRGPLIVAVVERGQEPDLEEIATGDPEGGDSESVEPVSAGLSVVAVNGEQRSNFLTGKTEIRYSQPIELGIEIGDLPPDYLVASGAGTDAYLAWRSGEMMRVDTSDLRSPLIAERGRLVASGRTLTALQFVLGNTTLVWADSEGELRGGFPIRIEELNDEITDALIPTLERHPQARTVMVVAKELAASGSVAVTALAPSARTRLLLAGFEDGHIELFNVSTETRLGRYQPEGSGPLEQVAMAPKDDGVVGMSGEEIFVSSLNPRYSETSLSALFRPMWYEGYSSRLHIWQSSSGTDDFEPKYGLMPLIFGTIKATFYSMLFGAPLALLAAVFTSEFLDNRTKSMIKPSIELMASLPSVVLGFLAALVIAPYIETVIPAVLALIVALPLVFLLGAYAWQLAPQDVAIRLERRRIWLIAIVSPLAFVLAAWMGPAIERLLFGGDFRSWLSWAEGSADGQLFGNPLGGWMFLVLPAAALAVFIASSRWLGPRIRRRGTDWSRQTCARIDCARFGANFLAVVALAFLAALVLTMLGFDPRGGMIDTFEQRNALVVGFVMGFAVIPIIYTISEDALSTVPEHLRSASLGAGATPWQTSVRIIIPTAMSGLFSALMIGLGRAVGETMIVLMAAGNTPVMEWNVFNGFRTLSANIAVELPEAVRNSAHYRTLFLAALVLFAMTFLVNTIAEIIRLRFRKKAYQL